MRIKIFQFLVSILLLPVAFWGWIMFAAYGLALIAGAGPTVVFSHPVRMIWAISGMGTTLSLFCSIGLLLRKPRTALVKLAVAAAVCYFVYLPTSFYDLATTVGVRHVSVLRITEDALIGILVIPSPILLRKNNVAPNIRGTSL